MTAKRKNVYPERSRRVFVAMSGGVDSSVAAALLKKEGYDVVGVHMRCYNIDGCAAEDAEDARRAAEVLGIPFYVFDFEDEYKKKVVDYMVRGYREGITPNPDVMCNKEIKFGLFLKKALEMGADYVATGHYVRLTSSANSESITNKRIHQRTANLLRINEFLNIIIRKFATDSLLVDKPQSSFVNSNKIRYSLMVARDQNKDQSYFLWTLTQEQLRRCLFPIGGYLKAEVRVLARKFGLPNALKKDSQGICFLGKVTLQDFLKEYIPERRGEVLLIPNNYSPSGARYDSGAQSRGYINLGIHHGAHLYTIGQRHLGVNFQFPTCPSRRRVSNFQNDRKPIYVAEKDIKTNTLVVAEGDDNPALYRREIKLQDVNIINLQYSNILQNVGIFGIKVYARVRYRQPLAKATLVISNSQLVNGNTNIKNQLPVTNYQLLFDTPIKFVAPGQSAVFYASSEALAKEDSVQYEMLGGGIIA